MAIDPAIEALFQYARSRVTEQDIRDFSPSDPGYQNYVRLWTEILRTGVVPEKDDFDLSEVIGLTGFADREREVPAERFRRYRRLTSVVAVALAWQGNDLEMIRPPNYLARDLIIDLDRDDPCHLPLLRSVFPVVHALLASDPTQWEYPYFTFGEMILAQIAEDWANAEQAATRLIQEDSAVREKPDFPPGDDPRLLLGLTIHNQHHENWQAFAANLKNPTQHEATQLVIEALLPSSGKH